MMDKVSRLSGTWKFHVSMVAAFILFNVIGLIYAGGLNFVQSWGGGMAAVIATYFLIFKSKGYWTWMIVNAGLWTYLFFHTGVPMLAWLQISIMVFSIYGLTQWALVHFRIGFNPRVSSDLVGAALGLILLGYSVYAYRNMPDYTGTYWWYYEFGSVLTANMAMWMDAFKYKFNWVFWTASNCFSGPLFYHLATSNSTYWGVFYTIFLYQTFNIVGFIRWYREERRLRQEGKVEFVGAAGVL